jgi:prevent-host-death family protein
MRIIDIAEVLVNFEQLIEEAAQGHPFIIAVNGKPKVKVVPIASNDLEESPRFSATRQLEATDKPKL